MDTNEKILIETQERSKSNTKRINALEEEIKDIKSEQRAIYEIATSVKVLVERVGYIETKVDETSKKIDKQSAQWQKAENELSSRISETKAEKDHQTAENVDSVKIAVITAMCTALATGALSTLLHLF